MQSGQLPLHIEYTLPDVATFFKKVLKGLPGGLLGSLEIFEIIADALLRLDNVPSMSGREMRSLRAKLVALSLLSIASVHRFNLVQGVFGLFAYLADQAESSRECAQEQADLDRSETSSAGLMGYQAMGVCLGPLLTGDLMDNVGSSGQMVGEASNKTSDNGANTKKKKKPDKLEKSADLDTLVGRAHQSANVMEQMLMIWGEVVEQLRMATTSEMSIRSKVAAPQYRLPYLAAARNAIRVTDDELLFLKMIRGGEVPLQPPFDVVVKRKVTARGKASRPHLIGDTHDKQLRREWFHEGLDENELLQKTDEGRQIESLSPEGSDIAADLHPHKMEPASSTLMERQCSIRKSVASLDDMIAGQILPPRMDSFRPTLPSADSSISTRSPPPTPTHRPRSRRRKSSIGMGASTEVSNSSVDDDALSLCQRGGGVRPPRAPEASPPPPPTKSPSECDVASVPGHRALAPKIMTPPRQSLCSASLEDKCRAASIQTAIRASSSGTVLNVPQSVPAADRYESGCASVQFRSLGHSSHKRGGRTEVHDLAECGTSPLRSNPDTKSLCPSSQEPVANTPRKRESLIPKPMHSDHRSCSSLEQTTPEYRRKSLFNLVKRDSHGPSKIAVPIVTRKSQNLQQGPMKHTEVSTRAKRGNDALQPLSPQSLNSIAPRESQGSESLHSLPHPDWHGAEHRGPSEAHQNIQSNSPSRIPRDARKPTNSTLYSEITRLKSQLLHKEETLLATQRILEAATMAQEEGPSPPTVTTVKGTNTPKRGSWNKGTLSNEVKIVKGERDTWRQRAEWAEKRLNGIEESGAWSERRVQRE